MIGAMFRGSLAVADRRRRSRGARGEEFRFQQVGEPAPVLVGRPAELNCE
jgi:hypothetical protein